MDADPTPISTRYLRIIQEQQYMLRGTEAEWAVVQRELAVIASLRR
jgi:hypothetical protein